MAIVYTDMHMWLPVVTTTNLIIIVYVLCAGLPYGHTDNMKPFAPFGLHGVFAASSIVFFSFVGFDGAINAAEEVMQHAVQHSDGACQTIGCTSAALIKHLQ